MALLAGFYRPGSYELPEMDVVVASTADGVHWFEQNALGCCVYIHHFVTFTTVYFNMAALVACFAIRTQGAVVLICMTG